MGPSPSIPSQSVIRLCPFLLSQPLRCEPTKHSAWTQLALTIRLVLTGRGRRMRRCCAALLRVMSDTDISRRASARPAPRFPARGLRKARCVVAGLAPARRCARCLGSPARPPAPQRAAHGRSALRGPAAAGSGQLEAAQLGHGRGRGLGWPGRRGVRARTRAPRAGPAHSQPGAGAALVQRVPDVLLVRSRPARPREGPALVTGCAGWVRRLYTSVLSPTPVCTDGVYR